MNSRRGSRAEFLDDSLLRIQKRTATVDDCLRSHPDDAVYLKPLLETAVDIQNQMAPYGASREFLTTSEFRLRKKLRAAIRPALMPSPHSRMSWIRVVAVILIVASLFASGGGVAMASARSVPGDPLYSVKRAFEQMRLAASWTAIGDVSLLAQYSDQRLSEVQALARAGREDDLLTGLKYYEGTLGLLDDALQQLSPNSDNALLERIQTQLSRHADILRELLEQVPPAAQEELARAIDRSAQSQGLVQSLRLGNNNNPDYQSPGQVKKETKEPKATKESTETKEPKATKESTETKEPKATKELKATKEPKETKATK